MRITEADREAARAERERPKKKMSAESVARLRQMADEREQNAEAEARFVDWFDGLDHDLDTLVRLVSGLDRTRVCGPTRRDLDRQHLRRRAVKLQWCLSKGWKATCVHDVRFFCELSPGELTMSDDEFFAIMPPLDDALQRRPSQHSSGPQPVATVKRAKGTPRPCEVCGKRFLAVRSDAKHCSPKCRNKASYAKGHRGNPMAVKPPSGAIDTLSAL